MEIGLTAVIFMPGNLKNHMTTNNNCTVQLIFIFFLLFGAFHTSYQHDVLANNHAEHEQSCEYCSSTGSTTTLPTNTLSFDLSLLSLVKSTIYSFVYPNKHYYRLPNPRAPPTLV